MRVALPYALVALLFSTGGALACSCKQQSSDGLLTSSAAIFTAVAQASQPATQGEAVTTFRVTAGYKGVTTGQTIMVRHNNGSSASCGVRFTPGETYTMTTYREEIGTTLFANLCSVAAMKSSSGQELLRALMSAGGISR